MSLSNLNRPIKELLVLLIDFYVKTERHSSSNDNEEINALEEELVRIRSDIAEVIFNVDIKKLKKELE